MKTEGAKNMVSLKIHPTNKDPILTSSCFPSFQTSDLRLLFASACIFCMRMKIKSIISTMKNRSKDSAVSTILVQDIYNIIV